MLYLAAREDDLAAIRVYFPRPHATIHLEIDHDKWNGQNVSPKDLVAVSGKIAKDRRNIRVKVKHLLKQ